MAGIGQAAKTMGKTAGKSIFSWLTDFAFRDLRLELAILWFFRIVYAFCLMVLTLIFVALCGIVVLGAIFLIADTRGASILMLLLLPLICIGFFLYVVYLRCLCELFFILFTNVFIEVPKLTKVTRIFVENKNTEKAGY